MMPITALLVALTPAQVRAQMASALIALGIRADLWRSGGTASTILTVVSTTFAGFTTTMVQALSAGFLPTATGAWLALLAYYVYGVTPTPATSGTGQVTLTNTGGFVFNNVQPGQAIFGNSQTGKQYTNTAVFSLGAATVGGPAVLTIDVVASTQGSAGNANPGEVSILVTSMNGVAVTNAAPIVGLDAQSDTSIRQTCTDKLAALSVRNPRNAYRWAVETAMNGGQPVNINRSRVYAPGATYLNGFPLTPPMPGAPGTVTIYCAAPSGAPSSSDLAAAALNVELQARVEGVTAALYAATEVAYTRTLTVWATNSPGAPTAAAIQEAAATAITAFFQSYEIGGLTTDNPTVPTGIFGSGIAGQIAATYPNYIFFVEDAQNIGHGPPDLALAVGQVATDDITINVRFATATPQ